LVAVGGAAATAGLDFAGQEIANVDFGQYNVYIYPLASALINAARKWVLAYLATRKGK